ncbi:MAG: hypothetical protein MK210_05805 [Dehalococcoidia bacterium]|nr:hypothetical protein [Dehalococcoidia bacterium]
MAILFSVVLIVLSACVVVYPFLRRRNPAADDGVTQDAGAPDREMGSLLEDMRILRLDHLSGNIPDGLYQEQLQAYRLQAAIHLRRQAQAQPGGADRELEQEVLILRLSSQVQDLVESEEPISDSDEDPET